MQNWLTSVISQEEEVVKQGAWEDIEKEINIQAQLFLHCKHYNGLVNNNMGYQ